MVNRAHGTECIREDSIKVHPCQVACASLRCARSRFGKLKFGVACPKKCCADFLEVSLQLSDPSKWTVAACRGFFREENILVLEARSI